MLTHLSNQSTALTAESILAPMSRRHHTAMEFNLRALPPNIVMYQLPLCVVLVTFRIGISTLRPAFITHLFSTVSLASSANIKLFYQDVPWLRWLVADLSPRRPGFAPGSVYVRFVVDKVALEHVIFRVLCGSLSMYFHRFSIFIMGAGQWFPLRRKFRRDIVSHFLKTTRYYYANLLVPMRF
jgi:hypothetical protein